MRGGARPGAGRPRKWEHPRTITTTISEEAATAAARLRAAGLPLSERINDAILRWWDDYCTEEK